jgi:acyl-CoA synthetase (AMP-forming)/AMP-acid ligase II
MDLYDPPVLKLLNNYGHSGLQKGILGTEIQQLLTNKYSTLLDLLPGSDDVAIIDPSSDRLDLTHSALKSFFQNEFDLVKYGIPSQSRVGILVPNGPELATTLICLLSKWCAAPINPNVTTPEMKTELESMKCTACIIFSGFANNSSILEVTSALGLPVLALHPSLTVSGLFSLELVQSPPRPSPLLPSPLPPTSSYNTNSNTSLVLHTSGTGGKKKLVPYSLEMIVVGVCSIVSSWNLSPEDRCLNMMPLFHIGGIVRNIFSPLLSGGSVITCNAFDPVLFWDLLASRRFTWYYAAPTMHHAILLEASQRVTTAASAAAAPSRFQLKQIIKPVRFVANAAGGLLPALAESLKRVFQTTVLTSYGMTEW